MIGIQHPGGRGGVGKKPKPTLGSLDRTREREMIGIFIEKRSPARAPCLHFNLPPGRPGIETDNECKMVEKNVKIIRKKIPVHRRIPET